MKTRLFAMLPVLFLLGACANTSVATAPAPERSAVAPGPAAPADKASATEAKPAEKAPATEAEPAKSGLTGQVLYQFLLGEIALQRGDVKLAAEDYADLAHKTRDVRLVRRAAEVAVYAQDLPRALDMARLWVELEPDSVEARKLLATILIGMNQLSEAKPQLETLLRTAGDGRGHMFLQFHSLLARVPDKQSALAVMKDLAAPYPSLVEAHLAVAQSAIEAGQDDLALTELDQALRLDPGSEIAALLKGQALAGRGDAVVLDYWKSFLGKQPDATRVRLAYARALTKAGELDAARSQFEVLLKKAPESPELQLAVGLLSLQMNDLDAAERNFSRALALGYPDRGLVEMYLGQVEEVRAKYEAALTWYRKASSGQHAFQAKLKVAVMLGKLHRVDEGLAVLDEIKTQNSIEAMRVVQTRAQVLSEAGRNEEALAVLNDALAKSPGAGDLLYDRAMIEEKMDRLADMEADLRQLIKLEPDAAHAYNALGYTLVDRTDRVDEGIALLTKALALSPDDPFILDSMGWAQYKAGHLDQAIDYLRRAYAGRADPEIAAHLGEVLWQKGDKDQAKQVWSAAKKLHPDNDLLNETLSKFGQ